MFNEKDHLGFEPRKIRLKGGCDRPDSANDPLTSIMEDPTGFEPANKCLKGTPR